MRILDRYIVRETLRHSLLGLLVFSFVFFVPKLVQMMELLVRHSGSSSEVLVLLLCSFPAVLTFTLPMAVLTGVLLGLGRMSADSELIAMTALGVGRRRMLLPIGALAAAGALLTLAMTVWAGPQALRVFRTTEISLAASQASFQVQPRVFDERFPRMVFYLNDVSPSGLQWNGVFLAETGGENAAQLTLAEEAIVIADHKGGKVELHLRGGTTHEVSRSQPDHYSLTAFGDSDWPLEVSRMAPTKPRPPSLGELPAAELLSSQRPDWREARIEFHRRLAFPAACLVFALVAVPLGARPRRGGRAAGFLLTVLLIAGYYVVFILGAGLARRGILPPSLGIWFANLTLGLLGLFLLPRMEQYRGESSFSRFLAKFSQRLRVLRGKRRARRKARARAANGSATQREATAPTGAIFPQLMDLYVLRQFLSNFALLMAGFLFLFEAFTFFELLDDIGRHRVPFLVVINYFRFLTPYLFYQIAPLGALVALLVTLGVMSKNNELVACKASGISLYRLSLPLLLAGLALAATMLALDQSYLPYASQRQDALHNQIKGRPPQTFFHPRQQWIFGENSKVYNYDVFDPARAVFGGLTVLELEPATFQVRRRVYASRARWDAPRQQWALESGWLREFSGGAVTRYQPFEKLSLAELSEPPSYFNREVRQAFQMNIGELSSYIEELRQAGFDVSALTVQWHKKLAYPLIVPVSILLAIPFGILVGTRGAVGGVALGIVIGIVYIAVSRLLEAMGGVGQLPPLMAGWSPDLIFFFVGMYFYLKMPT